MSFQNYPSTSAQGSAKLERGRKWYEESGSNRESEKDTQNLKNNLVLQHLGINDTQDASNFKITQSFLWVVV